MRTSSSPTPVLRTRISSCRGNGLAFEQQSFDKPETPGQVHGGKRADQGRWLQRGIVATHRFQGGRGQSDAIRSNQGQRGFRASSEDQESRRDEHCDQRGRGEMPNPHRGRPVLANHRCFTATVTTVLPGEIWKSFSYLPVDL